MKRYLWEILVPCAWNSGRPIRTKHHQEWDRRVREITGGMTILPPGKGYWMNQLTGVVHKDRVIPVRIMCTDLEISFIASLTIEHYEQEAVMYFKVSDACQIQTATPAQKRKFQQCHS